MNESGRNKREWIKTAAIIFLSVMLVLTFFSSTIQNWSLPEVATQYVQSGTITAKATITGTVESVDPYEVKVTESRKVASVAVRTGDTVQKGDVLIYLEDKDSTELEDAKKALQKAQSEYNKALLSANYSAAEISEASQGVTAESYMNQITRAQNTVKAAENAVNAAEDAVEAAEGMVKAAKDAGENALASNEAKIEIERIEKLLQDYETQIKFNKDMNANLKASQQWKRAEEELRDAENERDKAYTKWYGAQNDTEAWDDYVYLHGVAEDAQAAFDKLNNIVEQREKENLDLQNEIAQQEMHKYNYQKAVNDHEDSIKKEIEKWQKQLDARNEELEARKKELEEKQKALKEIVNRAENVTGLQTYLENIEEAQKKVDELTENAGGTTITAPIAGVVSTINVKAGNETSAAVPVVVMQREGQGFILKYSASNDIAKRLSVGDVGSLMNAWRYDDVKVTLESIKVDPDSRGQNKLLTFNVTGSVVAGQSLSFTVGQKSANYNFIVPNSAVREDNNGKFILIVESKPSPLGTRYTASRVDVQIIASDETQSAVSGALSGYEFVITTSTKPVQAGSLVRLPD